MLPSSTGKSSPRPMPAAPAGRLFCPTKNPRRCNPSGEDKERVFPEARLENQTSFKDKEATDACIIC